MDLSQFILELKSLMKKYPMEYKEDKLIAYRDMNDYVSNELTDDEAKVVSDNVSYLISTVKSQLKAGVCTEKTLDYYPHSVAGMYLMMVRTNKSLAFKINREKLPIVSKSFGGLNYFKYAEAMEKMFHPSMMNIIDTCDRSNDLITILKGLIDSVIGNIEYDKSTLESFVNQFLFTKVYPVLGLPKVAENLSLKVEVEKQSILSAIDDAKRLGNTSMSNKYEDKISFLGQLDSISKEQYDKFVNCNDILQKGGMKRFVLTDYKLTILGIMSFIDVTELDSSVLIDLAHKMSNIKYDKFKDVFTGFSDKIM